MMQNETLDSLIPEYGQVKAKADEYKKEQENLNSQIKDIMRGLADPKYEADGWEATFAVVQKEAFDEDKLVALFMSTLSEVAGEYEIIKYRPYVDMNAVESAIYDNRLDAKTLALCKTSSSYERLTIKQKGKKNKNDENKSQVPKRRRAH